MPIVKSFISNALINGFILYLIARYGQNFHFTGLSISPITSLNIETMVVLGFVFYIVYYVLRKIVKLFTFPINWISLGIFGVVINILMLYLFKYLINNVFHLSITITLGNFFEVFLLSIIIYLFNLLLK